MKSSIAESQPEPIVVQESEDALNSLTNPRFNQQEIEQILREDHEQYDISLVLNSHVLE